MPIAYDGDESSSAAEVAGLQVRLVKGTAGLHA